MSTTMKNREDRSPAGRHLSGAAAAAATTTPSPNTGNTTSASSLVASVLLLHHRAGQARSSHGGSSLGGSEHGGDLQDETDFGTSSRPTTRSPPTAAAPPSSQSSPAEKSETQVVLEQIQTKIERTKELLREEQTSRDYNVNEYLKLSSTADRDQQVRIKHLFEKKNQKSSQRIVHYQKKLEEYQRRMQDVQENGLRQQQQQSAAAAAHKLKSVGGNLKDSVMSKPKGLAHLLRQTFVSADDLNVAETASAATTKSGNSANPSGSSSLPRGMTPSSAFASQVQNKRKCISDEGRRSERSATSIDDDDESSSSSSSDNDDNDLEESANEHSSHRRRHRYADEWKTVMQELMQHKEQVDHLREKLDDSRLLHKQEVERLGEQLRDEGDRYDRLEVHMNDLTELHQRQIEGIRTAINEMEEKVQYQSEERLLDVGEQLMRMEAKVATMDLQHQQQQQHLNIEGLDSTSANAVVIKLLAAVITVIQVLLFVIGSVMNLVWPFLRTSCRAACTAATVLALSFLYVNQDQMWTAIQAFKEKSFKT